MARSFFGLKMAKKRVVGWIRRLVLVRWLVDGVPSTQRKTAIFVVSYYSHYIQGPCPATCGGSWKGRYLWLLLPYPIANIFLSLTPVTKKKWPSRSLPDSCKSVDWIVNLHADDMSHRVIVPQEFLDTLYLLIEIMARHYYFTSHFFLIPMDTQKYFKDPVTNS